MRFIETIFSFSKNYCNCQRVCILVLIIRHASHITYLCLYTQYAYINADLYLMQTKIELIRLRCR